MPELPKDVRDSRISLAIYKAYENKHEGPRRYLGASVIGKPCARALWYEFRWCGRQVFEGRMLRLFQTGSIEECRIVHNLKEIGIEVHEVDSETKQQFAVSALGGHFKGHLDGSCLNVPDSPVAWHVLEMKTHSEKSFNAVKSKGVRESKPEHFAQMQIYMHLTGMERALYFAVNKNTDEIYTERIKYDFGEASRIMAMARSIITTAEPPEKISDNREFFQCRWCCHNSRCHGPLPTEPAVPCGVTCRSCCHATAVIGDDDNAAGVWRCEKHGKSLADAEQERACDDHIFLPGLLTFADVLDSDGNSVRYSHRATAAVFWNGKGTNLYSSKELTLVDAGAIGHKQVQAIKDRLGGTIVDGSESP